MLAVQTFEPLSQYLCSKCGSILKETNENIKIATLAEDCPNCGAYLASSLTKQKAIVEPASALPKFQTAFDLTKFKIDIAAINKVMPLSSTGSLCISGHMSNVLLTRLMIRALLPVNYGGLDSPFVIVVDAGNKSDFYQTVKFVRSYGLDLKSTLDRIIVSRTFTIYQLKSLLLRELPKVKRQYQAGVVIVPGLLDVFDDPNIKKRQAKKVLQRIMTLINEASNSALVIASFQESKYAEQVMPSFEKRITLKPVQDAKLKIDLYNEGKKSTVALAQRELAKVRPS